MWLVSLSENEWIFSYDFHENEIENLTKFNNKISLEIYGIPVQNIIFFFLTQLIIKQSNNYRMKEFIYFQPKQ